MNAEVFDSSGRIFDGVSRGKSNVRFQEGVALFDNLILRLLPATEYSLHFYTEINNEPMWSDGITVSIAENTTCTSGMHVDPEVFECLMCERGTYMDAAMTTKTECQRCPPNSQTPSIGSAYRSDCICELGFVGDLGLVDDCYSCDEGSVCGGGVEIDVEEGFFKPPGSYSVYRCNLRAACSAGYNLTIVDASPCNSKYTGNLCSECGDGYSRIAGYCIECSTAWQVNTWIAIPLVVILFVTLNRMSVASAGLQYALDFFAEMSQLLNLAVTWPVAVEHVLYAASILAFNCTIITPGCSIGWKSVSSFYLQAAMPLIVIVGYTLYYLVNA